MGTDRASRVMEWLAARGVRRGEPAELIECLREAQRKKVMIERENVRPVDLQQESSILARRLKKKITILL